MHLWKYPNTCVYPFSAECKAFILNSKISKHLTKTKFPFSSYKKYGIIALLFILLSVRVVVGQEQSKADFNWGNAFYYNMDIGDSISFNGKTVKLISVQNHYNNIQIEDEILTIKVSRRTLPVLYGGIRIFVADNKNVKSLSNNKSVHGLLKKDVLVCLSNGNEELLDPNLFVFPISFNDGFLWKSEEDSHMFAYIKSEEKDKNEKYRSHEGIDINLNDARGIEKHWLVAIENSTVVWIEDKKPDKANVQACVLLESESQPGIYYIYKHLYNRNIEVKKGQKIKRGELIGTIWGDNSWGHIHLGVVKSDTIPTYANLFDNTLNFFPQLFELYYKQSNTFSKSFTKGKITFGNLSKQNGNEKNLSAFEEYSGKGWLLGKWNVTDKVEHISTGEKGNARLKKILFSEQNLSIKTPGNWYDYEINVRNGVYRIRAEVGDLTLPTWQKIVFEGVTAATYSLDVGEFKWTNEKVVKVFDRKLTIRIYVDESNLQYAGLSEIVFQRAY